MPVRPENRHRYGGIDSLRQYAMLDGEQLASLWGEIDELRGALYDEQHGISFHLRDAHLQEWQEHGRYLLAAHRGQLPSEAADLYGGGCGCPQCAEVLALLKGSNDQAQGAGGGLIAGGSPGATGSAARTYEGKP